MLYVLQRMAITVWLQEKIDVFIFSILTKLILRIVQQDQAQKGTALKYAFYQKSISHFLELVRTYVRT